MGEVSSTLPSKNLLVFFLPHHTQNVKFMLESCLNHHQYTLEPLPKWLTPDDACLRGLMGNCKDCGRGIPAPIVGGASLPRL